jgi:hypothetical protein
VGRVVEAVLPARMGTSFRWLVGSSWTSNLGDGIALAGLLQRLPWLLFGLYAGVLAMIWRELAHIEAALCHHACAEKDPSRGRERFFSAQPPRVRSAGCGAAGGR